MFFLSHRLPVPRTSNELLKAEFGYAPASLIDSGGSPSSESTFSGPVLVVQGILDPLHDALERMNRFKKLRKGITTDSLQAGHCPHDEVPQEMARSIFTWMTNTRKERSAQVVRSGCLCQEHNVTDQNDRSTHKTRTA